MNENSAPAKVRLLAIYAYLAMIVAGVKAKYPILGAFGTGSGKSLGIPMWLAKALNLRILVAVPRVLNTEDNMKNAQAIWEDSTDKGFGCASSKSKRNVRSASVVYATYQSAIRIFQDFDYVIVDEIHERNAWSDILIAILLQKKMGHSLLSATVNEGFWKAYYAQFELKLGVAKGETRKFAIEKCGSIGPNSAYNIANWLATQNRNTLVFLSDKSKIEEIQSALKGKTNMTVFPLHGDLEPEERAVFFQDHKDGYICLATNIAQAGITPKALAQTLITGEKYSPMLINGQNGIGLQPISKADFDQQAGRAGRMSDGKCFCTSNVDYDNLPEFDTPEILKKTPESILLECLNLGIELSKIKLPTPLPNEVILAAYQELIRLEAIDEKGLTSLGKAMLNLQLSPIAAKIVIEDSYSKESCILATVLDQWENISILKIGEKQPINVLEYATTNRVNSDVSDVISIANALSAADYDPTHKLSYRTRTALIDVFKSVKKITGKDYGKNANVFIRDDKAALLKRAMKKVDVSYGNFRLEGVSGNICSKSRVNVSGQDIVHGKVTSFKTRRGVITLLVGVTI